MNKRMFYFTSTIIAAGVLLAACAAPAATQSMAHDEQMPAATEMIPGTGMQPTDAMMEDHSDAMQPTAEMMDDHSDGMQPTEEMMDDHSADMQPTAEMMDDAMMTDEMAWPDWTMATLTNVNTGETFKVSDFKGKVILVENLAMWCPNCLKQQQEVKALHEQMMGDDSLVTIGLDVDINENAQDLKAYTQKNGFDWVYAVAGKDVAAQIGKLYGDQFLNPSSTPMLLIDPSGQVHLLPLGIKSADDLASQIHDLSMQ